MNSKNMNDNHGGFFDRLFSGTIKWALHTAMTCDLAYMSALIEKQQGDQALYHTEPNCAFFYDGRKTGGLTCKMEPPKFRVRGLEKYAHRLNDALNGGKTHHAKLSLICCEYVKNQVGFRLAVYSRNLEFSGSLDTSMLFELVPTGEETGSGKQLYHYLCKLCSLADSEGKKWIKDNVTPYLDMLKRCTLKSEFGRDAELYFGGISDDLSLGSLLSLDKVTERSIVLTPPVFIKGTCAEGFFTRTKRILYDSKEAPSHIKLYLLEKPENDLQGAAYELWIGSANATKNGLGWDFAQKAPLNQANVECLVKFGISGREFDALQKDITQRYDQYTDFKKPGSLVVHPDNMGPYIVKNFRCVKISYSHEDPNQPYKGAGTITVTLEKIGKYAPPENERSVAWRPLEYSDVKDFDIRGEKSLTLTYKYKAFRESQGILVFGSSCCIMKIDADALPAGLPMQKDALIKDTCLTNWLMWEPDKIPNEDEKWDIELKWLRRVLCGVPELPVVNHGSRQINDQVAASLDAKEVNAKPMAFQENGAERLSAILEEHSRAFLADEPGLGKTFTSALLIDRLSRKKGMNRPFFVLYIAPNLALLENNGRELVDKLNAVSEKKAVLLSDYVTPKEALKRAYREYYKEKINNVKKRISRESEKEKEIAGFEEKTKRIIDKIDGEFHYQKGSNEQKLITTYIKSSFVDPIREAYGDKKGDRITNVPTWNGYLLREYEHHKANTPNRLAYAYEVLEKVRESNPAEFQDKIVIITVSAEIALGEPSDFSKEKQIISKIIKERKGKCEEPSRAYFTKIFLEEYCCPDLIIWDEFHRYISKLKADNPFFAEEKKKKGCLKSLFVSATPYKTNISGGENNENKKTLDELYQVAQGALDDESPDVTLPSFKGDFVPLFCDGKPELCNKAVEDAYDLLSGKGDKSRLEELLKMRMIRNERTRLQGYYEEHIPLSNPAAQYGDTHAEILKRTYEQCRLLKNAGYPDGALRWSMSMPWILCFSTSRTQLKSKDGYTYFERLAPPEGKKPSERLFVYEDGEDGTVCPKENLLMQLPKYNLAMLQICEHNIPDPGRRAAQLLWMPATMPLYQAGEKSIFTAHADYSKLLVFAEYRYLQRGGAILLSDYCKLLCKGDMPKNFNPTLSYKDVHDKDVHDIGFLDGEYRDHTLDDLLAKMPGGTTVTTVEKLYRLASPAACAKRLGLDPEALTDAFNAYFRKDGVKEALWSWLSDNEFYDPESWEEGILRYCAEGNLYAVLREWLFCMKEKTHDKQMEHIVKVLGREHSQVGVQTCASTAKKVDGKTRPCGFAEQLTGDVNDVGTGENTKNIGDCCKAFNSPFYPMILFAGSGAQEGIDLHNYCLRIMHLTLPRGAVSYEQRNGRIDRYRSLLVRRRAAELIGTSDLTDLAGVFNTLKNHPDNRLYPNWSIPSKESKWHFEELMPVWEHTEESCFADAVKEMLRTYRESMGVHNELGDDSHIDLSTT